MNRNQKVYYLFDESKTERKSKYFRTFREANDYRNTLPTEGNYWLEILSKTTSSFNNRL